MKRPALLIGSEWLPNRAGGLNRYFHGLCYALARSGRPARAVVTYVRPGQSGPIPIEAMAPEGTGLLQRLNGARVAALAAFDEGVSLANPHFALYAWPWLRHMARGTPLVVSFHGPWAGEMLAESRSPAHRLKATAAKAIERAVYLRADRCITLSHAFREVLTDGYGVLHSGVAVVPGGADLDPFKAAPPKDEARSRLGWPSDRKIVVCIRRLTRRMGIDLLISSAVQLRREIPGLLMLVSGRGHAESDLKAHADACGVSDVVRFLGFLPDEQLPLAYAAADLTVVPSVALEGFGLVIVESLASGTPAIATPVGGMPEALMGFPELVADAATAEALGVRLAAGLVHPECLPSPTECRAYAARFGWDHVLPELVSVWKDVGADVDG